MSKYNLIIDWVSKIYIRENKNIYIYIYSKCISLM